jgi:peptide deformylase
MTSDENKPVATNPIITTSDPERWPLLEVPSQECGFPLNDTDAAIIAQMDSLLEDLGDTAAGLAAVQIGYPKRIFLLSEKNGNRVFINPVVIRQSKKQNRDGEACLSLPGMGAYFKRPKSITIEYRNLDGALQTETFNGFWARAICHEMDHLNGVLITQYLEQEMSVKVRRTTFGMALTPHRRKVIAARRARNKRAKAARRANRE